MDAGVEMRKTLAVFLNDERLSLHFTTPLSAVHTAASSLYTQSPPPPAVADKKRVPGAVSDLESSAWAAFAWCGN